MYTHMLLKIIWSLHFNVYLLSSSKHPCTRYDFQHAVTVTRSQIKTDYVRLFSVIVLFLCLTEVPKIDMSQELWGTTKKNIKKSSCVGPKNSVLTSWKVHRSDIYIIYFIDLVVLKVWHTNISLLKLIVLNLVKHNNWTNMALVSSSMTKMTLNIIRFLY